jgi:hypothetical protein
MQGDVLDGVRAGVNDPLRRRGGGGKCEAEQHQRDGASAQERTSRARKQAFAAVADDCDPYDIHAFPRNGTCNK